MVNLSSQTYQLQHLLPSSRVNEVSICELHLYSTRPDYCFIVEVYRFLASEVKAYLPSYDTVTVWHLRDLAMGAKTII